MIGDIMTRVVWKNHVCQVKHLLCKLFLMFLLKLLESCGTNSVQDILYYQISLQSVLVCCFIFRENDVAEKVNK